jgi:methyl-accepting chemotaxis protein
VRLTLVQPEYAASQEYSRFWQALNRRELQAGEFERFTKNGHSVRMQATYTPILGLDGKPEKVVSSRRTSPSALWQNAN